MHWSIEYPGITLETDNLPNWPEIAEHLKEARTAIEIGIPLFIGSIETYQAGFEYGVYHHTRGVKVHFSESDFGRGYRDGWNSVKLDVFA